MKNLSYLKKYFNVIILLFVFNFSINYAMEKSNLIDVDINIQENVSKEELAETADKILIEHFNCLKSTKKDYEKAMEFAKKIEECFQNIVIIDFDDNDALNFLDSFQKEKMLINQHIKSKIQKIIIENSNLEPEIIKDLFDADMTKNAQERTQINKDSGLSINILVSFDPQAKESIKNYCQDLNTYVENLNMLKPLSEVFLCVDKFCNEMNNIIDLQEYMNDNKTIDFCERLERIYITSFKNNIEKFKKFDGNFETSNFSNQSLTFKEQTAKYRDIREKISTRTQENYNEIEKIEKKINSREYDEQSSESQQKRRLILPDLNAFHKKQMKKQEKLFSEFITKIYNLDFMK